jgi:ribonuclease HI
VWGWGNIQVFSQKVCRWFLNGGSGTNSKAELLGAWGTLTMEKMWNITKLKVFGDSKGIIDWLNNGCILNANHLEGWKYRTKNYPLSFKKSTSFIFSEISTRKQTSYQNRPCSGFWQADILLSCQWEGRGTESFKSLLMKTLAWRLL